jgi:hypothetical protein
MTPESVLHADPVPGIRVVSPEVAPDPNGVLLGYEVIRNQHDGACCGGTFHGSPRPSRMNGRGWIAALVGAITCLPLACVPCFASCSYDAMVQRPVYATLS